MMHPPLQDFDFAILDAPSFKEDSVREEIIAPLLRALGYKNSGENRIIRSMALDHPYVMIGSKKKPISIIPDYVMFAHDRPRWVLDAKSPREAVDDPEHVAQAYSYAMHRDVQASWFAVCNGHELALYHVSDTSNVPRFRCRLSEIAANWSALVRMLIPDAIATTGLGYAKDFGIHLMKLGIPMETELRFASVPVETLGRVSASTYTLSATFRTESGNFMISFDFAETELPDLLAVFAPEDRERVRSALTQVSSMLKIDRQASPFVSVRAKRGGEIIEGKKEHYVPLQVLGFGPAMYSVGVGDE